MQTFLKSPSMQKFFHTRNLKCNDVLPFVSCNPIPDWEKRDVPVVVSFGFPRIVPKHLLARYRSNKLLKIFAEHIKKMFPKHEVTEVDHNQDAKVPYLLCTVDDVTVNIKISIKPFCGPQYLAKDVVEMYKRKDDRFITLANYFYQYLKAKAIKKSDQRKAKSVIPKLCSIKMMFIHLFKHYGLLPADRNSLEGMMSSLSVAEKESISLGTLFFLFLDYYLDVIPLETDFLEISTGESIKKKSIGLTNLNILSISDIFDDHIPGERVNDTLIFKKILKSSFLCIEKHLNNRTGDILNDLRVIPLRPKHIKL
uniref:CDT1 domain-containing protein n=2 Tax=Caenorhabditis tropicalis TaxID=1561998 RepID=A0A1I7T0Y0_9PELO